MNKKSITACTRDGAACRQISQSASPPRNRNPWQSVGRSGWASDL